MSKDKIVHIQARIPESTREEFRRIAERNAQNPSALIRLWIEKYIKENKEEHKMYNEIVRKDNFPLQDEAYVVGEKDGRYFFAWGSIANQEEMPSEDILDGANGIEWFDAKEKALASYESAVEAAEVSKGDE